MRQSLIGKASINSDNRLSDHPEFPLEPGGGFTGLPSPPPGIAPLSAFHIRTDA
jgi:hypothetical protein